MVPELAGVWVRGLAAARRNPQPVEVAWGLRVDVGRTRERARHVLLRSDAAAVRAAAATADEPNIWIKAFVEPEQGSAWLGPGWQYRGTEFVMTTALTNPTLRVPDGYTLSTEETDSVIHVRARTAEGDVASAGYATVNDGVAVMDRVATYPEHQRRGLGTLVMEALAVAAVERGAHTAALGATDDGRALYESLGWTLLAPLAGFVHQP
ncbi:GNAT family N-acetyltransferase [Kitasatospora sp. NPDC008050]|uniref:GNAT family N-acetyltransferase n=1 Tax=Kitasatospora sp. NPDC008050 TaxID=3364021 RepID=UPI0036E74240